MKNIATIAVNSKDEALKYAYAFMNIEALNQKECSFHNPNPTKYNKLNVFPKDMFSAQYDNSIDVTWEDFKVNPVLISSSGFSCVACLDEKDEKRVTCMALNDVITFNFYGNYEDEARKAFEDIKAIHSALK